MRVTPPHAEEKLSIDRLTEDERATYLIGKAIRAGLIEPNGLAPRQAAAVLDWVFRYLPEGERLEVEQGTGFVSREDFPEVFEELPKDQPNSKDDAPF